VAILVEVQPRAGEPDRVAEVVEALRQRSAADWRWDVTRIEYDDPEDEYGNLQFAVLWNASRGIQIEPSRNRLLEELRQPRSPDGTLVRKELRAPWLIPLAVAAPEGGDFECDLLALHLKSGGGTPQAAEVDAITRFLRTHQSEPQPRHLIVCGDWNIRPDESQQGRGRPRLLRMTVPQGSTSLLRLLTVGELGPTFAEWEELEERLGPLLRRPAIAQQLPYSHLGTRESTFHSLLDHLAISRTLEELFDHPVEVRLEDGRMDRTPGIEIVAPRVSQWEYLHFTDHLPVVLTLRAGRLVSERRRPPMRIWEVEPNPAGDERQRERVVLRNMTTRTIDLRGWRIQDAVGQSWELDEQDGELPGGRLGRGATVAIWRRGRPMTLTNSGDTITLFDPTGAWIDSHTYGPTRTGDRITTE
jgi:hypothetical protein